jgi:hypothetical protein
MFKVEFAIVHEGCLVNELSREFPEARFICPGGFIQGQTGVSELIVIEDSDTELVAAVVSSLQKRPEIENVRVLERTGDKAFVYFKSSRLPETFCSQVVQRNEGFPIGREIQEDGLEKWTVGCVEPEHAEQLLKDMAPLGTIVQESITETSWQTLLGGE